MTAYRTFSHPRPRHLRVGRAVATLALLVAAGANAETNPYYIGLTGTYAHESNLLQLADGQAAPDGYRRGDSSYGLTLLGGLDQPFGRQRAYANLAWRDTRYSSNPIYNNQGYTAQAGLDWSTAERVSGSLSASANRGLYAFNIGYNVGLLLRPNLQDTDSVNASVNVGLVTQYSLVLSAGHLHVSNSLQEPTTQALNYSQDNAAIGLRWRPTSATTWGVTLSETRGRYPNYLLLAGGDYTADRFTQPNVDLSLTVQASGASNLDAHIGYSKTRYDLNRPRDFSGVTGRLLWSWQPDAKLRLTTRLARDTGQSSYAITVFGTPGVSDYSQIYNTLRLQADYAITSKISLTTAWQVVQRTIVNTIQNPYLPLGAQGKDHTNSFSVGARWAPLRSVLVGCDLGSLQRTASGPLSSQLHDDTFSCFGQFQLQQ